MQFSINVAQQSYDPTIAVGRWSLVDLDRLFRPMSSVRLATWLKIYKYLKHTENTAQPKLHPECC